MDHRMSHTQTACSPTRIDWRIAVGTAGHRHHWRLATAALAERRSLATTAAARYRKYELQEPTTPRANPGAQGHRRNRSSEITRTAKNRLPAARTARTAAKKRSRPAPGGV